ncbi:MAG: geranylgeranylglycerol-phosphate geranylgeranyltransferase [Candidatus Thermoplasmatota archaeon]|nr:geranylgeranylglycerol-phosphate geranylgeranyltransferase [Candidatus Thermoplasmatota archaeon]
MAHPVWQLVRGGNIIVGTLTVSVGAIMVTTSFTNVQLALILLHSLCVATFMAAWNTFNDVQDHENDALNHPERPIPSGALSLDMAKNIGRFSFLLSFIFLVAAFIVTVNYTEDVGSWLPSIGIWIVAVLLMFHYEIVSPNSLMLKHKGLAGNLAISLLVGIVIVFGAAAVSGIMTPLVWLVALVAMLVNAAREIVKDVEDLEGDIDRQTLPKKIGPDRARGVAQLFVLAALIPIVAPYARGLLPMGMLIAQTPAMFLLVTVKPKLYRGEDYGAQRSLRMAMMLGLLGFLASVLIPI